MSTNVIPAVSPDAHCASSTLDHREILDLSNDTLVNLNVNVCVFRWGRVPEGSHTSTISVFRSFVTGICYRKYFHVSVTETTALLCYRSLL